MISNRLKNIPARYFSPIICLFALAKSHPRSTFVQLRARANREYFPTRIRFDNSESFFPVPEAK